MEDTNLVKSNIPNKEKTQDNLEKTVEQTKTYQVQEQFCSCCKPGEWADFFNKKKSSDMFCPEVFNPDSNFPNNQAKFKSHKIFVKKNDI